MKKILLGISVILLGFGAKAQELARPISIGPKLGGNMASIWSEQEDIASNVYGINAGAVVNIRLAKKHAIQTELNYSGKGFERTRDQETKHTLHYAELPFLYQRSFFSSKKGGHLAERRRTGNVYFILGPQVSVLLKSSMKFTSPEVSSETHDLYVNTRPFDMSAVGGIGYNMKNGFVIDARYAFGLRHLHTGSETAYIPQDVTNTAVQLSVSYLLPIKFR